MASEISGASEALSPAALLESRRTERVSGSKKTSPVWNFIHRLVNGPAINKNGKATEYICILCLKSNKPWTLCLVSLSNHNPANELSHLKCCHRVVFNNYMDEQLTPPSSADKHSTSKTPVATGGITSMLSRGNLSVLDKVHVHLASVMVSHGLPLSFSQSPDVTALLQAATELKPSTLEKLTRRK